MTRSPTHNSHPNSGGGKFDEGKVVGVVLFETRRDGSKMFERSRLKVWQAQLAGKAGGELLKKRSMRLVNRERKALKPGAVTRPGMGLMFPRAPRAARPWRKASLS